MQQACESSGGETGEVVQNDEVGTGSRGWHLVTEATAAMSAWELHRGMMSMEGREVWRTSVTTAAMSAVAGRRRDESQERRSEAPTRDFGTRTLEGSEAHEGRTSRCSNTA